MKIVLLGGDGQLGWYLRASLAPLGTVTTVTRCGLNGDIACDLSDLSAVRATILAERPALVVNAAAYTAVDAAEDDLTAAETMNSLLPGALGEVCHRLGAAVIHYSTDYVFAGDSSRPYREDDATAPLNVYGRTKLAGEEALAASGADHLVLRTAWVYSLRARNFLTTMLRLAKERDELRVVSDQHGCPTSAPLLADTTARIASNWMARRDRRQGIYHLTATGGTTWHGFAEVIVERAAALGALPHRVPVRAIRSADFPTPAKRPAWSLLETQRVRHDFALTLPTWEDDLIHVLAPLASGA
ncbi:MAG TPA: dTDP-4-dehydrorhamnose reductase [Luteibacter sp.]|uniref:dTDP-4-dehydrorhamnose reductase n=1 Tax=Luteibacter sp. TaxID=1886636 RepID=UPI002F418B8E